LKNIIRVTSLKEIYPFYIFFLKIKNLWRIGAVIFSQLYAKGQTKNRNPTAKSSDRVNDGREEIPPGEKRSQNNLTARILLP